MMANYARSQQQMYVLQSVPPSYEVWQLYYQLLQLLLLQQACIDLLLKPVLVVGMRLQSTRST